MEDSEEFEVCFSNDTVSSAFVSLIIGGDFLFPFSEIGVAEPLEIISSSFVNPASTSVLFSRTSPPGISASSDPGTCKRSIDKIFYLSKC